MADQNKNFNLTAFLVGGILGASASLLFTPRSGRELRTNIKHQAEIYLREAKLKADNLIKNSKSTGELLKTKAEDLMETVKQYAAGKMEKPFSVVEKEINGLRAAINAVKASYSLTPEINKMNSDGSNGHSIPGEFEDETLPKHLGMGKGRNRKSFYS